MIIDAEGRLDNAQPCTSRVGDDASRRPIIPQREQVANVPMSAACCKLPGPESPAPNASNDDRLADLVSGLRICREGLSDGKTPRGRAALPQDSVGRSRFDADLEP